MDEQIDYDGRGWVTWAGVLINPCPPSVRTETRSAPNRNSTFLISSRGHIKEDRLVRRVPIKNTASSSCPSHHKSDRFIHHCPDVQWLSSHAPLKNLQTSFLNCSKLELSCAGRAPLPSTCEKVSSAQFNKWVSARYKSGHAKSLHDEQQLRRRAAAPAVLPAHRLWGRGGRRDAGHGEGPGRGRALEEDPAEHLHQVVQRAPEVRQQDRHRPAEGFYGRAEAHLAAGGAEPEENVQKVPHQTQLPSDEAGKCFCGTGVPGQGAHQTGLHRWVGLGWLLDVEKIKQGNVWL